MFRSAYESAWQHPGIAWIAGLPLLVIGIYTIGAIGAIGAARRDRLAGRAGVWLPMFLALEAEILLDAWMTGAFSPLHGAAAEIVAVVFVILGDLRFFYLVRLAGARGAGSWRRALPVALAVSLIVPVTTGLLHALGRPGRYQGTLLYLLYEAGLFALAIGFTGSSVSRAPDARTSFVRRLLWCEVAQYGLWVIADALILAEIDAGWLLRMVPNALYYAAFVPVATWGVPQELRA